MLSNYMLTCGKIKLEATCSVCEGKKRVPCEEEGWTNFLVDCKTCKGTGLEVEYASVEELAKEMFKISRRKWM